MTSYLLLIKGNPILICCQIMNRFDTVQASLKRKKYRSYSPTQLTNAYIDVVENKFSVYKASRKYSIPEQTLRDRVNGNVKIETTKSGPDPLFSEEEEARLVKHIQQISAVGYGYTRVEVMNLGTEYAIALGKRDREHPLSLQWLNSFIDRWPDLKVRRPKTISELRAKATSRESIEKYFKELESILDKYDLRDKPECIYNVDEKGIQHNHSPPYIVASSDSVPSVITAEKSSTVTILGCGNALGYQIPPFFVFPGARMRRELMEGCSVGAEGTVSKTGWSNSEIFTTYLQNHFVRFAKGRVTDQKILLLYDGHRSHFSPALIDWAIDQDIILYVLPPHTSHILQPMDVGCFGPFSKIYGNECHKFQRTHAGSVNKYNICNLACKAYTAALSPNNLRGAFRRTGIFPFDPSVVSLGNAFLASDTRKELEVNDDDQAPNSIGSGEQVPVVCDTQVLPDCQENRNVEMTQDKDCLVIEDFQHKGVQTEPIHISSEEPKESLLSSFFEKKKPVFFTKSNKQRRSINKIVGGKAITENSVANQVKDYVATVTKPKTTKKLKFSPPFRHSDQDRSDKSLPSESSDPPAALSADQPGPSGIHVQQNRCSHREPECLSSDSEIEESEKCCVCKLFEPKQLRSCVSIVFTKWGKCMFDNCDHWVHLGFCTEVRVLRRHDIFYCPCHGLPAKSAIIE
ncbi:uncharacterized protein LOC134229216 [Saccostrea cucullata]|uniref:uncharacterized protein LOC134229216 n=1 Tax=Saccostrea cuccullata TaxID=36930 RepID=UPI002ED49034